MYISQQTIYIVSCTLDTMVDAMRPLQILSLGRFCDVFRHVSNPKEQRGAPFLAITIL